MFTLCIQDKMASGSNNTAGQPDNTTKYWNPFFFAGKEISLSHLEPHEFLCNTPDGNARKIRAIYSPHVFTRSATDADPASHVCFDNRVYCPNRYQDALHLPGIIQNLPNTKVFQTWEERNYVYLTVDAPFRNDRYHVFFELKKSGGKRNKHVLLRIESAYRASASGYLPPENPNSIRFSVLIQSTYMGRAVRFARR